MLSTLEHAIVPVQEAILGLRNIRKPGTANDCRIRRTSSSEGSGSMQLSGFIGCVRIIALRYASISIRGRTVPFEPVQFGRVHPAGRYSMAAAPRLDHVSEPRWEWDAT